MKSFLPVIVVLLAMCASLQKVSHAQIKTSGIKTHYPRYDSGSLILSNGTVVTISESHSRDGTVTGGFTGTTTLNSESGKNIYGSDTATGTGYNKETGIYSDHTNIGHSTGTNGNDFFYSRGNVYEDRGYKSDNNRQTDIYTDRTNIEHSTGTNGIDFNYNRGNVHEDRGYKPADTFNGGSSHYYSREDYHYGSNGGSADTRGNTMGHFIVQTTPPTILDATADFINRTRATIAPGICYTEVPTSTLVRDGSMIPVGNGTTPNMSKIQICCDGYERNPHVLARCDPICVDNCRNGICTAPNTCVCMPDHVRDPNGKCTATCPIGCGNGVCNSAGECQCKEGYRLDPVTRKFCVPHCEPSCNYGKCVEPNKCDCEVGYRLTAAGICEPHCDNCDNGICTAPGFCTCNKGYMKVAGRCEPVCALGCESGRCVKPDVCECNDGFSLDRTGSKCQPHCDQPCLNGVCNGHNRCICNSGYVEDEVQKNVCKPYCAQGCPNGFCTAPNLCVCKPGFIKSGIKGRQTCIAV